MICTNFEDEFNVPELIINYIFLFPIIKTFNISIYQNYINALNYLVKKIAILLLIGHYM